jgi:ABC-type bacteriocin/lantibiotic exporter with double-glycine peptidase domain
MLNSHNMFILKVLVVIVLYPLSGDNGLARAGDSGSLKSAPDVSKQTANPKTLVCGPNSLYMLLRMCGRPVTFEQVARQCGSDNRWTTMLELRDAADRLGLATRVRRGTLDDLDSFSLPFIAHSRSQFGVAANDNVGHYLLVVNVGETTVDFVDGTCGDLVSYPRDRFMKYWTGYLLEPSSIILDWSWRKVILSSLALSAVLALVVLRTYRRSPGPTRGLRAGLLLVAFCSTTTTVSAAVPEPSPGKEVSLADWRSSSNDGVNCLYLQLAILGYAVDYPRVREAIYPGQGEVSIATLRDAATRCGLRMRIVRCNVEELKRMPKPVITYLHDDRKGGTFVLLNHLGEQKCGLILGSTVSLEEMSIDQFRRDWSGVALIPDSPHGGWRNSIAISFVLLAGYFGWRHWRDS